MGLGHKMEGGKEKGREDRKVREREREKEKR